METLGLQALLLIIVTVVIGPTIVILLEKIGAKQAMKTYVNVWGLPEDLAKKLTSGGIWPNRILDMTPQEVQGLSSSGFDTVETHAILAVTGT